MKNNNYICLTSYLKNQASAYEAYDGMCMPLYMPKTLETCKKNTPCLIKTASRCEGDHISKTTTFLIFHFL